MPSARRPLDGDCAESTSHANSPAVERALQRYRDVRDGKRQPTDKTELDRELERAFAFPDWRARVFAEGDKQGYERGLREGREQERRNHLCPMDIGPALDQSCKEAMETGRHEGLELAAQRAGLGYAAGEECDDIARDIRALGEGKLEGGAVWLAADWKEAGAREEREACARIADAEGEAWQDGESNATTCRIIACAIRARTCGEVG